MDPDQNADVRTGKAKKGIGPTSIPHVAHSKPTTFFLKTEKELEQSMQRGRQQSRDDPGSADKAQHSSSSSKMEDSSFGVHSLEDTINSTFSDVDLSRTSSNSTDLSGEASMDSNIPISRKRKVHPKIKSAGQRIISSEHLPSLSSTTASPVSVRSAESPFRSTPLRRRSISSSVNLSQPLTPVRKSSQPHSAAPSTPRSSSSKSFRLSDEEVSAPGATSEPALTTDQNHECPSERTPQLVMPSLSMPARRPFTEQGKSMGRMKLMIVGSQGVGKTSFIHSILRLNEHIVHVDAVTTSRPSNLLPDNDSPASTSSFAEVSAATKPYPAWWTATESSSHGKVFAGDIFQRNLTIIDTPSLSDDRQIDRVKEYLTNCLHHTTNMDSMSDSDFVAMLGGDGGTQVDAMIYIFEPTLARGNDPAESGLSLSHQEFLRQASRWTNLIPVVGHADAMSPQSLKTRKEQVTNLLKALNVQTYRLNHDTDQPLAISSAPGDDTDIIDASLLMSSQYLPPLAPSDLDRVVEVLFLPHTISRLRRLSASKVLIWREETFRHRGTHRGSTMANSPLLPISFNSPAVTSTGSMLEEPSKVLVPYGSASYYRSTSPSVSDSLALPTSAYSLDNVHVDFTQPTREVITARWAQDLTRSRENETRRYAQMHNMPFVEWDVEASPSIDNAHALVPVKENLRPGRGRLGGKLGVIDPTDPLGVLAFGQTFERRGFFALQIASSCGLLAAVCYTVVKYWSSVQRFCGLSETVGVPHAAKLIAPSRMPVFGWETGLRTFFGRDKW